MPALQPSDAQVRRRRVAGALALAGAALGLPALVNLRASRRLRALHRRTWVSGSTFSSSAGKLAYARFGSGPPLLLLHSFGPGHSSAQWRAAAERLAEHVEVVVPDLPGWGRSAAAPVGVDAAFYVELLREMVDGLIGEPTLIVAAGLPAAYAVALATTHPDRVSGLGLIAPTGLGLHDRGARFVDRLLFRLTLVPVLGEAAMHLLTRRPALERHLRELTADSRPVDAVALEEIELNARRATTRGALAAFLTGRLDFDARPALRRLDGLGLPVWLGWGRRATRPPIEAADLWLRRLDSARLDVFEQAGSLPHAEAPAEVASRLVSWARASEAVGHRAGAS